MNMIIIFAALGLTLFSTTIVCLATASRSPRCTICNGRIVVGHGQGVCENCNSAWRAEDHYYH
jgi:hypothetical protein